MRFKLLIFTNNVNAINKTDHDSILNCPAHLNNQIMIWFSYSSLYFPKQLAEIRKEH